MSDSKPIVFGFALTDIKTGQAVEIDPQTGKFRPSVVGALDLHWGYAAEDIAAGDALVRGERWGLIRKAQP